MILLGVLLLICWAVFHVGLFFILGVIFVLVGAALAIAGRSGHAVRGRSFWY